MLLSSLGAGAHIDRHRLWLTCDGFGPNTKEGVFKSFLPNDLSKRLTYFDGFPRVEGPLGIGWGWDVAGDGSLVAIDLPRHLDGHIGLCFPRFGPPFYYAVDVQWLLQAVIENNCPGIPASLAHHDTNSLQKSVARVKQFAENGGDFALCHEPGVHRYDIDTEVGP